MLNPVLLLGGLGLLFGMLLSVTSAFINKDDEKLNKLREALPGYNCGACGYPGCDGYAAALLKGAPTDLCRPGREKTLKAVEEALREI